MNQPKRMLQIEIRTVENPGLDSAQIKSITVYEDKGSYYLAFDFQHIKSAIIEAVKTIISLGSNYRHPLYFDVQVISGDGMDAGVAQAENRDRRRRRRKKD